METKVFKAGDFVIQYFVLITSLWFGPTIWFGPIENQTMGWQGVLIYICYREMFRQKGWGVLKHFSLKTATDLNHHDLKLLCESEWTHFPSTPNEWERKRRNQSPAFQHNFPGQFYLLILDFCIDTKLNPF